MEESWTRADDFQAYAYMDGAAGRYFPEALKRRVGAGDELDESYAAWWDKGSAETIMAGEMTYRDIP